MATNFSSVDQLLTASAATVLTAPAGSQIVILKATAYNSDTLAHSATLYRIASGGSAAITGQLTGTGTTIGAGGTVILPISGLTLSVQQFIQAKADLTSVVSLSLSYAITP